ncbi:hypothetical protein HDU67_002870 [Dinochytrium kinnereticum]|nr:hypothetical protein HDU67_002870 [Dinochytrium kinnereticum]
MRFAWCGTVEVNKPPAYPVPLQSVREDIWNFAGCGTWKKVSSILPGSSSKEGLIVGDSGSVTAIIKYASERMKGLSMLTENRSCVCSGSPFLSPDTTVEKCPCCEYRICNVVELAPMEAKHVPAESLCEKCWGHRHRRHPIWTLCFDIGRHAQMTCGRGLDEECGEGGGEVGEALGLVRRLGIALAVAILRSIHPAHPAEAMRSFFSPADGLKVLEFEPIDLTLDSDFALLWVAAVDQYEVLRLPLLVSPETFYPHTLSSLLPTVEPSSPQTPSHLDSLAGSPPQHHPLHAEILGRLLHMSSRVGAVNLVKVLVSPPPSFSSCRMDMGGFGVDPAWGGNVAIQFASFNGHASVVSFLLSTLEENVSLPGWSEWFRGFSVSVDPSSVGNLAIQYASSNGHAEVVRMLLSTHLCDPTVERNFAISHAAANGHLDVVDLLLRWSGPEGQVVNPIDEDHLSLCLASENGHADVCGRLLMDPRVDVSAGGSNRPLIFAASMGYVEVVKTLLGDGRCDPSVDGSSALRIACVTGRDEVVEVLMEHRRRRMVEEFSGGVKRVPEGYEAWKEARIRPSTVILTSGSMDSLQTLHEEDDANDTYYDDIEKSPSTPWVGEFPPCLLRPCNAPSSPVPCPRGVTFSSPIKVLATIDPSTGHHKPLTQAAANGHAGICRILLRELMLLSALLDPLPLDKSLCREGRPHEVVLCYAPGVETLDRVLRESRERGLREVCEVIEESLRGVRALEALGGLEMV